MTMEFISFFATDTIWIFTDFQSRKKLGEDIQLWLDGGSETGMVSKNSSFTYSYDKAELVPDGYYYTTIVHFADGTMLMTEVKQK